MHCLLNEGLCLAISFEGYERPFLQSKDVEQGQKHEKNDEGCTITYSYSFFHLISSPASMYSTILPTSWTSLTKDYEELIDIGWPSICVCICTEWITTTLYV